MRATRIKSWRGTGYNRHYIFIEYEYRGQRYIVYENRAKGNEPLAWQHKAAQAKIDKEIEIETKAETNNAKPVDLDEIWEMMGWD